MAWASNMRRSQLPRPTGQRNSHDSLQGDKLFATTRKSTSPRSKSIFERGASKVVKSGSSHAEPTDSLKARLEQLAVDIQAVCDQRDALLKEIGGSMVPTASASRINRRPSVSSSLNRRPSLTSVNRRPSVSSQAVSSQALAAFHHRDSGSIADDDSHSDCEIADFGDTQPGGDQSRRNSSVGSTSSVSPQRTSIRNNTASHLVADMVNNFHGIPPDAFKDINSLEKEWTPVPEEPVPNPPTQKILQPGHDDRELTNESSTLSSIFDQERGEPEAFPEWILKEDQAEHMISEANDSERLAEHTAEEAVRADLCVISPTSWVRIVWDSLLFLCLSFEFWAMPFTACFFPDGGTPASLRAIDDGITIMFAFDIFLNFFTGFVVNDVNDILVLQHWAIIRHYLSSWFWIDLLSTIPFDKILVWSSRMNGSEQQVSKTHTTNALTLIRWAKLSRILRTLRYLRMIRAVQKVRSLRKDLELMRHLRQVVTPLLIFVALVCVSHIHACIFAVVQTQWQPSADPILSLKRYYESIWTVYCCLTLGRSIGADSAGLWTFEMFLATERLIMLSLTALWIAFQAMLMLDEDSRQSLMKDGALRYLQNHAVSIDTQVQVLHYLTETQQTKSKKRHFVRFMSDDVPLELYRTICEELWGEKLMSLGLIMKVIHWSHDFLVELAMVVTEDYFASKSYIFREGDSSLAAYNIISGAVMLWSTLCDKRVPDFTVGMWVGEKALVNPMLRRSVTCCTRSTCVLMDVPAADFQQLLSIFDLKEKFIEFCESTLWRGVCGRCGLVGYHFAHDCTAKRQAMERSGWSLTAKRKNSGDEDDNVGIEFTRYGIQQELMEFLRMHRLRRLVPNLQQHGLTRLDDLEQPDDMQPLLDDLKPSLRSRAAASLSLVRQFRETFQLQNELNRKRSVAGKLTQATNNHHFFFLSHYKVEAGTEAALMRSDLEQIISESPGLLGDTHYDNPIFLDSEDLEDVSVLQAKVRNSKYLALMLTSKVLTRPWCLVEIATAWKHNVPVLLVEVMKKGTEFTFPDDTFFEGLREGWILNAAGRELLSECEVDLGELEAALRKIFKRISVPYSPHRPANIRKAELQTLFKDVQSGVDLPSKGGKPGSVHSAQAKSGSVHSGLAMVHGRSLRPLKASSSASLNRASRGTDSDLEEPGI